MAGSLKWMKYQSDDENEYRVLIDESNGENFDFDDVGSASADALMTLPKRYEMRYVVWRDESGKISRKFHCGKPTSADFVVGGNYSVTFLNGNAAQSVEGAFTYAVGEKRPIFTNSAGTGANAVNSADTGLNDGDLS